MRWDASGTATELGDLGLSSGGFTSAQAYAVNDAGTAVGYSVKYVSGSDVGYRAVRWDASGTATELGNLGTDSSGFTAARAYAVNDAGTAVGYSNKYVSGGSVGLRAVRWDASGTATELGDLGTNSSGFTEARAYAVNDAGTAVGISQKYVSGNLVGNRAVIWLPDASVIDLNDLGLTDIAGGGAWVLTSARALSSDGWVAGSGTFTPTVGGAYTRHFVTQVGLGGAWTEAFTGSLDGTWGRGNQWTTGTPAMSVGDAVFDADATYTVSLDRNELTRSVTITAGTVTIDFAGFTLGTENGLTLAGGTLKGSGTIGGDVIQTGGRLAAGNSPGIMGFDSYTLSVDAVLEVELAGAGGVPGSDFDFYDITGVATLAGTLDIVSWAGFVPTHGDTFEVLTALSIDATGLTLSGLSGFSYSIIDGGNGEVLQLLYTSQESVIPEPASAVFTATAGLLLLRRRSRRGGQS